MDHRVEVVIALMKGSLHRKLPLGELAQSVNLSVPHLHYLFKAETDMGPAHYHRWLRIKEAAALLGTTFLSVKQIGASIGFNDRSHFEREFKKVYNLTPTQYRAAAFNLMERPPKNVPTECHYPRHRERFRRYSGDSE